MDEYDATTLAEISSAEDALSTSSDYVRGPDRLHTAYNSSLMTDEPLTAQRVNHLIQRVEALFKDGVICWTAGTHDFPRLKSRWSKYQPSEEFLREAFDSMFAALIISLKGNCCIYQGDELGLTQADIPHEKMQDPFGIQGYPQVLGRDGSRTPMPWRKAAYQAGFTEAAEPWLPIPEEHLPYAVDVQEADPKFLAAPVSPVDSLAAVAARPARRRLTSTRARRRAPRRVYSCLRPTAVTLSVQPQCRYGLSRHDPVSAM
jgi:alpha-glucosidase